MGKMPRRMRIRMTINIVPIVAPNFFSQRVLPNRITAAHDAFSGRHVADYICKDITGQNGAEALDPGGAADEGFVVFSVKNQHILTPFAVKFGRQKKPTQFVNPKIRGFDCVGLLVNGSRGSEAGLPFI
jgi:hypothetical protein